MTIRHLLHDAGRCLRAAAPPVLVLGLITALRTVDPAVATLDRCLGLALQAATVASALWLVVAMTWAAARPWRDRRAHERLDHLRDLAGEGDRALVHVKTTIWSTAAGERTIVLNIATGGLHRVWLPETTVPVGAFAVLEHTNRGVRVIAHMDAHVVEAAHRHERRSVCAPLRTSVDAGLGGKPGDPARLIREVEAFLQSI